MELTNLPLDNIYNILSRLSIKYLARIRCVSKQWCNYVDDPNLAIIHGERNPEEPIPIIFDEHFHSSYPPRTLDLCELECEQGTINHILKVTTKVNLIMQIEVGCSCHPATIFRGSCNGLISLSKESYSDNSVKEINALVVINPLRNELFKLPPMEPMLTLTRYSYGLGFDASTNTYKMICVIGTKENYICTMVHVLGTHSWRAIPQIPSYPLGSIAIFAKGNLYWLGSRLNGARVVTCFDVQNEEFGLIEPPEKRTFKAQWTDDHLVDLNSRVGFVYYYLKEQIMELWILKKNEWRYHCRLDVKATICLPSAVTKVEVLGRWSNGGDILIRVDYKKLFVYSMKNGCILHEIHFLGWDHTSTTIMYQRSLFSIQSINTNAYSIKKLI